MNTLPHAEEKFSPWKFLVIIFATFGAVEEIFSIVLHRLSLDSLWELQVHPVWWKALAVFLIWQIIDCFVEWFFHRYMLHSPLVPGFSRLFVQHHKVHHMLTLVSQVSPPGKEDVKEWKNNYPIDHERKYRASYFPFYTYAGFVLFSLTIIVAVQALLPTWPVLMFAVFSIGWSLVMYEFLHAIEHLPMTFWSRVFNIPFLGRIGERLYAFHENHHEWSTKFMANQNISGFFCGVPLADMAFGTMRVPKRPLFDGSPVNLTDVQEPIPRFRWIRRLDVIARQKVAAFRSIESAA